MNKKEKMSEFHNLKKIIINWLMDYLIVDEKINRFMNYGWGGIDRIMNYGWGINGLMNYGWRY